MWKVSTREAENVRNVWKHFKTITHHRRLVRRGCFRVGLYWQGLTHDLSKYSPTEFWTGVRYYQGNRSPNTAEREDKGYSEAWMHHKGRNKHHFEYWTDINPATRQYEPVEMPRRYLAEMVMDRIAACKTYQARPIPMLLRWPIWNGRGNRTACIRKHSGSCISCSRCWLKRGRTRRSALSAKLS